ncbi:long-chain-fatty-acid--CoA ligase, putative [Entamoeba invadens IP1]|uniref:long-chain-fatty-acid--CoA ligase, putative n=1 Tax=Entamoeba invadens IP1 TaxID=370355 RepID=UPI0002C3D4D5|nr:long-chain-fatty-acid--CoA ligase, putative [Entamoeba invadens IP1]ELP90672.1 long-chain-fatty-acid--CoA ligase, putative [Entamoeba invadens IP1]|eukprot:XP_004257443.1 long-chain-fatty-acid--CoA ligase, putative [Entamoeba invadens IP1]
MFLETLLVVTVVTCVILYFLRPKGYPKEKEGEWVGVANPGETRILRGYKGVEKLTDFTPQGNTTIADLVNSFAKTEKKDFIGYREQLDKVSVKTYTVKVNGKDVEKNLYKYKMSDYKWISSIEFYHMVCRLSAGLRKLGLKKGDKIGMFCETRYEWMAMALACNRQGIIVVTVYATLGEDSAKIALEETKCSGIIVSSETSDKLDKILPDFADEHFQVIDVDHDESVPLNNTKKVHITGFKQLNESEEDESNTPTVESEDLAFIMYTSGTTRNPKGVLVGQKQILLLSKAYNDSFELKDDKMPAYLPLAHIFELCFEFAVLSNFGSLGYANPRTLLGTSCSNCKSDMLALQPTFICGVPTVYGRVRKSILENISNAPLTKQRLFYGCMELKKRLYIDYQICPPYLFMPLLKMIDKVVFQGIKESIFGKNIKQLIVGGSALPTELQTFLTIILPGVAVVQGFGMTELCGASSCMPPGDCTTSTIGLLFSHYEAKLRDVPDLNYFTNTVPPKGELMIRGPPVSKGYFNRPELTRETFTKDGWVCTGDICTITANHHLCIIDRMKNIIKQPCGEYISLELIESKYATSKVVDTICVFADAFHDFTIALVLPNKKVVEELSEGKSFVEACNDESVIQKVRSIMKLNESGLSGKEIVKHIALISEDWNPENEMLTAALKLKRPAIAKRYKDVIDALYAKN